MSQEVGESRRKSGTKTLDVEVRIESGSPHPVRVRPITLTNSIGKVVWHCPDLPAGARLQIIFPDDPRGPFFSLAESTESQVIGLGNRGPGETSRRYVYQVRIGGINPELVGPGDLKNQATRPVYGSPDPPVKEPPQ